MSRHLPHDDEPQAPEPTSDRAADRPAAPRKPQGPLTFTVREDLRTWGPFLLPSPATARPR